MLALERSRRFSTLRYRTGRQGRVKCRDRITRSRIQGERSRPVPRQRTFRGDRRRQQEGTKRGKKPAAERTGGLDGRRRAGVEPSTVGRTSGARKVDGTGARVGAKAPPYFSHAFCPLPPSVGPTAGGRDDPAPGSCCANTEVRTEEGWMVKGGGGDYFWDGRKPAAFAGGWRRGSWHPPFACACATGREGPKPGGLGLGTTGDDVRRARIGDGGRYRGWVACPGGTHPSQATKRGNDGPGAGKVQAWSPLPGAAASLVRWTAARGPAGRCAGLGARPRTGLAFRGGVQAISAAQLGTALAARSECPAAAKGTLPAGGNSSRRSEAEMGASRGYGRARVARRRFSFTVVVMIPSSACT